MSQKSVSNILEALASFDHLSRVMFPRMQPQTLPLLFFTEMWERFSYYGMRALLVLYLVNSLHYERQDALALYATYTGLVYLTPILGGYLADRYLGTRKAILIGGMTMALGHFAMAVPQLLHLALGLLIIGNGFFKPNIGTLLGSLYEKDDPRRDGGFIIFYMGVNLGAFLAPLIAGTLGEKLGWHFGFASAGVGMCLGLLQFVYGQHRLGDAGLRGKQRLDGRDWREIVTISLGMVPLVWLVLEAYALLNPLWHGLSTASQLMIVVIAVGGLLGLYGKTSSKAESRPPLTAEDWHHVSYILILSIFVIFFWMGFEQAGGTMNLFADRETDRVLFGWEMPASYFQAINPLAILLLGPLMVVLWSWLDRSRYALSTAVKMALGLLLLGLGFIVLAIADAQATAEHKVGPQWLVIVYLLHTLGELCLSPTGLAMVTNIAPAQLTAMMLGIWYVSNAVANYLAGTLEALLAQWQVPTYWFLVCSSIGAALLLLAISPLLGRLIKPR
ncbi:MAG TPA: peptide MFS transporter [Methylophilaceae bacterium]|nr:peptide MFS transporter [Methylophilaceae bacterium]